MVVVYCCNERYAEIFAVSLVSLYESNRGEKDLSVYLIENELSEKSKTYLTVLANGYQRTIEFISLKDSALFKQKLSLPGAYSIDTFSRLFMASLLPNTIERIIYLDCDTLVMGPLRELWELDLGGTYAGMVNDCENPSYRRSIGLHESGIYYNGGVLTADLNLWREKRVEGAFVNFIEHCGGYIPIVDQGVLNAVLDGKIFTLPLKFNVSTIWFAFTYQELCKLRRPTSIYSEKEVKEACKTPIVVHFTNNFYMPIRPWVWKCDHPYGKVWLQYREKTPWGKNALRNDSRSGFAKLYTAFCRILPKSFAINTSRMIQTYLFPIWHHYKMRKSIKKSRIQIKN